MWAKSRSPPTPCAGNPSAYRGVSLRRLALRSIRVQYSIASPVSSARTASFVTARPDEKHRIDHTNAQPDSSLMEKPNESGWLRFVAPILIVAVVAAAYCNSLTNSFIFDDYSSIVRNPNIQQLLPLSKSMNAPPGTGASGRPITALSLAVNYAISGLNPVGFHLFNIGAHACAALALYGLVRRTLCMPSITESLREIATPLATAVALLWAAHPLQTSAINHVVYRNEVLMGMFYLLTLYCASRGIAGGSPLWYVATWVACALGMGSKEAMVSAPIAVLLYDYAFGDRTSGGKHRWWLYLGLAATWGVLAAAMHSGDRGETVGLGGRISSFHYALTELGVIAQYLRFAFWPYPLVIDYQDWPVANSIADVGPGGFLVVLLAGFAIWLFIRNPRLGFPAALFFMVLAPTSSFIPLAGAIVGEHRMYLPLAAVTVYVVLAVGIWFLRKPRSGEAPAASSGIRSMGPIIAMMPVVAALAATTFLRNTAFRTEITFYRDVVAKRPLNARAHYNLGSALAENKQLDEAVEPMRSAWRLDPTRLNLLEDLVNTLSALGRMNEAADALADGAAHFPRNAQIQLATARSLLSQKRAVDAITYYRAYLELNHDDIAIWNELGQTCLQLARLDDAKICFERVLNQQPRNWIAIGNLAGIAAQQARPDDALRLYDEALAIQPKNVELLYGRIGALSLARRWPEVVREFEALLESNPSPIYMSQLCGVLSTTAEVRNPERAVYWGERAVEATRSAQAEPMEVLAYAYAAAGRFSDATATAEKALEIAQRTKNKQLTDKLSRRLESYRASQLPNN